LAIIWNRSQVLRLRLGELLLAK